MSRPNAVTACGHDGEGRVQVCPEFTVRMIDAACATRIGQRGEAQRLRREAALILREHLRLEALEHDGCGQ